MNFTKGKDPKESLKVGSYHNCIEYRNYKYWYEYRSAKRGEICLATKNPKEYCNGTFAYSPKDPGNGKEFVIIGSDNPSMRTHYWKEN